LFVRVALVSVQVKAVSKSDLYRKLPSVDELLRHPELKDAVARDGHVAVADAARAVLERVRKDISGSDPDPHVVGATIPGLVDSIRQELQRSLACSLRPVINGTGVILHTNLGRAPLAPGAIENIQRAAAGYSNLELDLPSGERGKRDVHVERLFQRLFRDSEDAKAHRELSTIVVNNNAAAVWLALNTLAARGEVIVSRGELVEIGGSFRIPDVMAQSNATLREVGTTNRTRIADYEQAVNENTRVLLRVHRSNFQITGFTEQAALEELVALARARKLIVVEDLGSGAIFSLASVGVRGETTVSDSLRAGVDVVTYSGDKLLGGPQAGMLTGSTDLIKRMRSNSLFRALRADKLTYAALEATLLAYVKEDYDSIPAVRMMRASKSEIGERAESVARQLREVRGVEVEVIDGESVIGGGAAPSSVLPTRLLAVTLCNANADALLARLRSQDLPLIARTHEGRVLIDLRTVFPEQDTSVISALRAAAQN
jgi:L-seryl-tRNA(Ser) seleniumtransferase